MAYQYSIPLFDEDLAEGDAAHSMGSLALVLLRSLTSGLRSRRHLVLENLALRQQLAVLRHRHQRPRFSPASRGVRPSQLERQLARSGKYVGNGAGRSPEGEEPACLRYSFRSDIFGVFEWVSFCDPLGWEPSARALK